VHLQALPWQQLNGACLSTWLRSLIREAIVHLFPGRSGQPHIFYKSWTGPLQRETICLVLWDGPQQNKLFLFQLDKAKSDASCQTKSK